MVTTTKNPQPKFSVSRQQSLFLTLTTCPSWVHGGTISVLSLRLRPKRAATLSVPPWLPVTKECAYTLVLTSFFLEVINVISAHISLTNVRYMVTPNYSGQRSINVSWIGKENWKYLWLSTWITEQIAHAWDGCLTKSEYQHVTIPHK